jgi:hypothetical protein
MTLETFKAIIDAKLPPGLESGIGSGNIPGENVVYVRGNGKSQGISVMGKNPLPFATEEQQKEAAERIADMLIESVK